VIRQFKIWIVFHEPRQAHRLLCEMIITLKPRYNDPFNNKFSAIKSLVSSPSVVDFMIKSPCNNKNLPIKNKIFGPFRFVKSRFQCINIMSHLKYNFYISLSFILLFCKSHFFTYPYNCYHFIHICCKKSLHFCFVAVPLVLNQFHENSGGPKERSLK
jgi:hypothetical protein